MALHPIERAFMKRYAGPFAVVRVCKLCGHSESVPIGAGIGHGRGYGMREGNKARGRIIRHIKAAHPAEVAGLGT